MCSNLFRKSVRKFGLTPVTFPILSVIFGTLAIPCAVFMDRRFTKLRGANRCTLTSKDDTAGIPNNFAAFFCDLALVFRKEYFFSVFFLRYNFLISHLWRDFRIFIPLIIEKSITRASHLRHNDILTFTFERELNRR